VTTLSQNLNFYRKQYEQDFKFWETDPTNQVVFNIMDDGDTLFQQYLQRVIANSSVVARKMHGPDRQTLLAGACKQRNEAGFQNYLQRCLNWHSPSSQNPKLFNSGPDNELQSTLDIAPNPEDLWEQHPVWASAKLGGEDAAAQGFRFGAQDESTPDLNSSQNRSSTESSILNSPFSSSLDFCSVPNISAANLFSPPRPHKK